MPLNESDARAKLIDPAIYARGWTEDLICREETAGAIEIINGQARRRAKPRVHYALSVKVHMESQPLPLHLPRGRRRRGILPTRSRRPPWNLFPRPSSRNSKTTKISKCD